jgi:diamine N-acetyltransferase
LVEITPENWDACVSLTVAPEQKSFVATNADSLAEAKAEPDMHPVGIKSDGKLVGFAMYGNDPEAHKSWIIRLMTDASQQRKGFGEEALRMLIQLLSDRYSGTDIRLCVEPENEVAIRLYGKYGFVSTGENWGNEMIYERANQSLAE